MGDERAYSTVEVAELAGLTDSRIRQKLDEPGEKGIRGFKNARDHWRIPQSELDRFLDRLAEEGKGPRAKRPESQQATQSVELERLRERLAYLEGRDEVSRGLVKATERERDRMAEYLRNERERADRLEKELRDIGHALQQRIRR